MTFQEEWRPPPRATWRRRILEALLGEERTGRWVDDGASGRHVAARYGILFEAFRAPETTVVVRNEVLGRKGRQELERRVSSRQIPACDEREDVSGSAERPGSNVVTERAPESARFEAIAFNSIDPLQPSPLPAGQRRLVYRLGTNDYRGERRLQLVVEHVLAP